MKFAIRRADTTNDAIYRKRYANSPSLRVGSPSPLGAQKRKNTTRGGVKMQLRKLALQGFDSRRELRGLVVRRENSSTGRVFYTAPTSNPIRRV